MLYWVGYKRQWRAQFVADISKELQLCVGGLFFQFATKNNSAVDVNDKSDEQRNDNATQKHIYFLMIVLCKVNVYLAIQVRKPASLLHHLLVLQQQHLGIVFRYQCPFEVIIPMKWLFFQNSHCQLHHHIATSGIDIRCKQLAVVHSFYTTALAWQRIGSDILHVTYARFCHSALCALCHTVVLPPYNVAVLGICNCALYAFIARFRCPFTRKGAFQLNIRIFAQCLNKTFVAVYGRRRVI